MSGIVDIKEHKVWVIEYGNGKTIVLGQGQLCEVDNPAEGSDHGKQGTVLAVTKTGHVTLYRAPNWASPSTQFRVEALSLKALGPTLVGMPTLPAMDLNQPVGNQQAPSKDPTPGDKIEVGDTVQVLNVPSLRDSGNAKLRSLIGKEGKVTYINHQEGDLYQYKLDIDGQSEQFNLDEITLVKKG